MCSLKTLSPGRNRLIVGTLKSERLKDEIYLENIDRKKLLGFSNWVMKVIQKKPEQRIFKYKEDQNKLSYDISNYGIHDCFNNNLPILDQIKN